MIRIFLDWGRPKYETAKAEARWEGESKGFTCYSYGCAQGFADALLRFYEGDHVSHFNLGDGIVVKNDGRVIEVRYGRAYGSYDQNWFNQNGRMLFHRNTAPLSQ